MKIQNCCAKALWLKTLVIIVVFCVVSTSVLGVVGTHSGTFLQHRLRLRWVCSPAAGRILCTQDGIFVTQDAVMTFASLRWFFTGVCVNVSLCLPSHGHIASKQHDVIIFFRECDAGLAVVVTSKFRLYQPVNQCVVGWSSLWLIHSFSRWLIYLFSYRFRSFIDFFIHLSISEHLFFRLDILYKCETWTAK